ncbi:MAG TPA: amino acid adenylation domain-containing protein [Puia sp.]|nr:amino acid adenylation domain-containing protein [Puia sp.]
MEELLLKLKKYDIDIKAEQGNLKLSIPGGIDVKDVLEEVKRKKEQLIAYLTERKELNNLARTIERVPEKEYYTLSSAQKRLYFLYLLDRSSLVYNMLQVVRLEGDLDKDRIEDIFNKLMIRHESLRTFFTTIGGEPVQKIAGQVFVEIAYFQPQEDDVSLIIDRFSRAFDLAQPPLIRIGLIRTGPHEHLLMIDMHHIITDGVSRAILIHEFVKLYNNEMLPELPLQYKDYAEWQQSDDRQKEKGKQKSFWVNEFLEEPGILELPIDYPRPPLKSHQGFSVDFQLEEETTDILKRVAETEGTSLFMLLLSIYTILLSKLGNREDIVVGVPVAGRYHPDLENIMGMFVNILPVRNYPKGGLPFREFLAEVKSRTVACLDNQAYQYEELIADLKMERKASHNPLFDMAFVFQNFDTPELAIPGLTLRQYFRENTVSKFDLTLSAFEKDGRIFLGVEYATALFKRSTIERFISCFKMIISTVTGDRHIRISDIGLITAEEKDLLLHGFNDTAMDYRKEGSAIALFEQQVRKTPFATAVIHEGEKMSYAELDNKANEIAARITAKIKTGTGEKIGLLFPPCMELIAGLLGVLKAGCAYVPLSPDVAGARNSYIISDCAARLVLVQEELARQDPDKLSFIDPGKVLLVSAGAAAALSPAVTRETGPDDSMYVIYTSGTSGNPKGVEVGNKGILNMLNFHRQLFGVKEGMQMSQVANICFDASVFEIWPCLACGGCLHLAPPEVRMDPDRMWSWLIGYGIEITFQPPAIAEYLVRMQWEKGGALKIMNVAGDRFNYFPAGELPYKLYNLYGPTEDSIWTTWTELSGSRPGPEYSIGRPVANKKIFITDSYSRLQPVGVPGELCIAGDGLAKGYVGNEMLTKEKFVECPFLAGERMYRTGDLARWHPDGSLEFLGRMDQQVKIRGNRIELGEIESWLVKREGIKEAVVVVKEKEGDQKLVAYYVSAAEIEVGIIRGYLGEKLPDYMIPSYYVRLDKMPVTANGKLDRRLLPEPVARVDDNYVAASGEIEEQLIGIWSEILKIDKDHISVNANFFELGGNSMDIVKLNNKIREQFNVDISVADMFRMPTITSIRHILVKGDLGIGEMKKNVMEAFAEADQNLKLMENLLG